MKKGLVVTTILALVAVLAAGCTELAPVTPAPTQPSGPALSTGTIEVRVTDAPGDVEKILVTVSEVKVHKASTDEEDGVWITLGIVENTSFNLLELEELELTLAVGEEVDAGKYTQLRMTIFEVWVTLDGEDPVEATVPSSELKFVRPFELEAGGTIALVVDFDAAESVVVTGNGKVIFKPVVTLAIQQGGKPQELTVEGTISALDTEEPDLSVSIIPDVGDAIVLIVNPQTEITLDDVAATLDELSEGDRIIASYYPNSLKATQIDAWSPSP